MKVSIGPATILFPTPVMVIGTYDSDDKANVMTAAWGGICCSNPPAIAVSLRKATYSHGNIASKEAFTINIPSVKHASESDFFGLVSGRDYDKLAATGMTPVRSELVEAPYIKEFPLIIECKLIHTVEIGLHTQFIGEILDLKTDAALLGDNGRPDIEKINPILFAPGNQSYFAIGKMVGKAFAIGKKLIREPKKPT